MFFLNPIRHVTREIPPRHASRDITRELRFKVNLFGASTFAVYGLLLGFTQSYIGRYSSYVRLTRPPLSLSLL